MAEAARLALKGTDMENFDILNPGVWFGEKLGNVAVVLDGSDTEKRRLEKICILMKGGDFSVRTQLAALISTGADIAVVRQAIRLYCFTCRHEDVEFIGNALERLPHDGVATCVSSAPDTLSPEIVPYLFAALGEYADTAIAQDVLASLHRLFPSKFIDDDDDLKLLAQRFGGFATKLAPGGYYYQDALAHPGVLCQSLVSTVAEVSSQQKTFPLANAPTLLSIWSGMKCPVFYGQRMSSESLSEVMSYVHSISKLQWVAGKKYFYQHEVM